MGFAVLSPSYDHDTPYRGLQGASAAGAAAVDRDDRAGRVAGAVGGEESRHVGDLARGRGAAEGVALQELGPFLGVAEAKLGAVPVEGHQALGHDRAGVDADYPDAVARRRA